ASAREAFDRGPWPNRSGSERSTRILALADMLTTRLSLLGRLWTLQVGMPVALGSRVVEAGVGRLGYYGELGASHGLRAEGAGRGGQDQLHRQLIERSCHRGRGRQESEQTDA